MGRRRRRGQAQKQLHNITHAIVSEPRKTRAQEQGAYERVMEEVGEDPGLLGYHNHEVEYRGHLDAAATRAAPPPSPPPPALRGWRRARRRARRGRRWRRAHHHHEHGADGEGVNEHEGEHRGDPYHEPDDDDEEHLAGALEALLSKLRHNESVPVGVEQNEMIGSSPSCTIAICSLTDSEQEVDMERVNKKILAAVDDAHVPGVPAYTATEHGTELRLLAADLVRKARLAPHREELRDCLARGRRATSASRHCSRASRSSSMRRCSIRMC